jgi:hypothetical protein
MEGNMPHRAIRIAAVACLGLLSSGSGAFADVQTYKERCVKCHARAATLARSLKGATPAEKTAWLEGFLATHHVDDAAERARLVDYLIGLTAK